MPQPRLIIHGGAGAITRQNLPPSAYARYKDALLAINQSTWRLLLTKDEEGATATALDAATHAVKMLEDCELFNCARGAVFTRDGEVECEASVMVSRGYRKRGIGVVLLKHVRNPILLAREILVRGEHDGRGGNDGGEGDPNGGSGGAQGHCVLGGPTAERLAREWGLEIVRKEYFWTRRRWEEHRRGLGLDVGGKDEMEQMRMKKEAMMVEKAGEFQCSMITSGSLKEDERWDGKEYLPQGTVGCVALDQYGTLCVATSTGGLTNKLSGRIGDTPTIGAGFWAEEWMERKPALLGRQLRPQPPLLVTVSEGFRQMLRDCIPTLAGYAAVPSAASTANEKKGSEVTRATAVSGTGNGDSFLRTCACRTVSAIARFSPARSLASAVSEIAGPGGELQRSAGDRWHKTGEGEGGMIGIEVLDGVGKIVFDFNCGGMFRTWVDDQGNARCMVFRDEYP